VRWAIAVAVVYYAYNTIGRLPEVREALAALSRGEQVDLTPAANAVRTLFGIPPAAGTEPRDRRSRSRDERPVDNPSTQAPRGQQGPGGVAGGPVYEMGQPGITPPTVTTRVPVRYPTEAARLQIRGTVILRCIIELDGTVSDVTVLKSLDRETGLDDEAVKAVKQWRFAPGRRDGVPVRVATPVSVTFSFPGRSNPPGR
jgi:TonB family protein